MPDSVTPPLRLSAGSHSVVGTVRDHNEDNSLCSEERGVFAVADGLGGHNAGERASEIATRALKERVEQGREPEGEISLELLLQAFDQANTAILEDARAHPEREGMGTTLTALAMVQDRVLIAHVGDCRAWRLRDGTVEQLTQDHTIVAQQLREGVIGEEEAERHPMRHVLSRCLGVREELEVDLLETDLAVDDVYLIASDGILPGLDLDTFVSGAAAGLSAPELVRELVESACEKDGGDNITAVVVRCEPA